VACSGAEEESEAAAHLPLQRAHLEVHPRQPGGCQHSIASTLSGTSVGYEQCTTHMWMLVGADYVHE
jgi:hypothetical protein